MGVAVGGLDLEHAVADFEDGHVERAAAQIEDGDLLVLLLVEAVGERRGGRLVDDAQHFEPGDLAGVLGGLALGVVEISRDGDDGLGDLFAQLGLGVGLQLAEDEGGDFLGRECSSFRPSLRPRCGRRRSWPRRPCRNAGLFSPLTSANLRPMKRLTEKMVFLELVTAWRLAAWPTRRSPRLGEGDDGRSGARAFGIFENHRLATFHDGHAGVGGA